MVGIHATKPYVLRFQITHRYTSAIVIYRPRRRCAASASSQEREFKKGLAEGGDRVQETQIAHRVGRLLAERLTPKGVTRVHLDLEKEAVKQERYTKRFEALVSGLKEKGIEIVP